MTVEECVREFFVERTGVFHYTRVAEMLRSLHPNTFKFAESDVSQILRDLVSEGYLKSGPNGGEFQRRIADPPQPPSLGFIT